MSILKISRKGKPIFVKQITLGELDKSKCSDRFLQHNLPDETIINVKCDEYGNLDLRGKKEEYRIIVPDGVLPDTRRNKVSFKKQKYYPERLFVLSIEEVFNWIDEHPGELRMNYKGYNFSLRRIIAHKAIGTVCVGCGLEGKFYALEKWKGGSLHLDMYTTLPSGKEKLMTIDHIIPRSKGGPDEIENYQMMCCTCNRLKGDKMIAPESKLVEAEYLLETAEHGY